MIFSGFVVGYVEFWGCVMVCVVCCFILCRDINWFGFLRVGFEVRLGVGKCFCEYFEYYYFWLYYVGVVDCLGYCFELDGGCFCCFFDCGD